jgi:hypothetical protein
MPPPENRPRTPPGDGAASASTANFDPTARTALTDVAHGDLNLMVSQAAKRKTFEARLAERKRSPQKFAQKRIPWSAADTEKLIEEIDESGCAWSRIAEKPIFEYRRDQQAIRDKARNLKIAFLK